MATSETTIKQSITKRHRPSLDELFDFIARFRGPGQILIHVSMGGHIQQFDIITTENPPANPKPKTFQVPVSNTKDLTSI